MEPEGFVIHSTATPGATAQNEFNYFNSQHRAASAHYFVDWQEIIRAIPENEISWHAGQSANIRYLSLEMSEPKEEDPEKFQEVIKRTTWLVADACVRYGWSKDNIYSHQMISEMYRETNHTDPIGYLETYGMTWDNLLQSIEEERLRLLNVDSGGGGGDTKPTEEATPISEPKFYEVLKKVLDSIRKGRG